MKIGKILFFGVDFLSWLWLFNVDCIFFRICSFMHVQKAEGSTTE